MLSRTAWLSKESFTLLSLCSTIHLLAQALHSNSSQTVQQCIPSVHRYTCDLAATCAGHLACHLRHGRLLRKTQE